MSKIDEARDILEQLGLPPAQRNDIACLTLLALTGLSEEDVWSQASKPSHTIHEMLGFMRETYGRDYAENTRETVRRQVIHQLEQAWVVDRNPDEPDLPTNSPRTHYGLTDEALKVLRLYGTSNWVAELSAFRSSYGVLLEIYQRRRRMREIPIQTSTDGEIRLSPGRHNRLQAQVVTEFGLRPLWQGIWVSGSRRAAFYYGESRRIMLSNRAALAARIFLLAVSAILMAGSVSDSEGGSRERILERLFVLEENIETSTHPIRLYVQRIKYNSNQFEIDLPPFDTDVLSNAVGECWRISIELGILASIKSDSRVNLDVYAYPDLVMKQVPEGVVYDVAQSYLAIACTNLRRGLSQLGIGNILHGAFPDTTIQIDTYGRAEMFLGTASDALLTTVHILGDNPAEYGPHGRVYSPPKANHDQEIADLWVKADLEFNTIADLFDATRECRSVTCMVATMEIAADTCDIANDYITDIVALSDDADWSNVQLHVTDYCDGLSGVVDLLEANQVRAAGPALDDALASLALALPYIEQLTQQN